uniref:Uncharacterized protein n=1 Tax=Methanosarcina mazei TaxID=2209 RepID=O33150_METMZ|nr:hypothetical protein [Methanosarcina mazei]
MQAFYNLNISHVHVPDKDFNRSTFYSIIGAEFFADPAAFAFKQVYLVRDAVFLADCFMWAVFPRGACFAVFALLSVNVVRHFGYNRAFDVHRYDKYRDSPFDSLGDSIGYKGIGNPISDFRDCV